MHGYWWVSPNGFVDWAHTLFRLLEYPFSSNFFLVFVTCDLPTWLWGLLFLPSVLPSTHQYRPIPGFAPIPANTGISFFLPVGHQRLRKCGGKNMNWNRGCLINSAYNESKYLILTWAANQKFDQREHFLLSVDSTMLCKTRTFMLASICLEAWKYGFRKFNFCHPSMDDKTFYAGTDLIREFETHNCQKSSFPPSYVQQYLLCWLRFS